MKNQREKKSQKKKNQKLKRKLKKSQKIPKINNEKYFHKLGFKNIVGIDEVGRGSWAGPLVAAAVCFSNHKRLYKIRDSKLLSAKIREKLTRKILKTTISGIGLVENKEIDKLGLTAASQKAYKLALKNINLKPDLVLIDAFRIQNLKIPQKAIIKGDVKCSSIAAASIIAKTYRDKLMRKNAKKYPKYYFQKNKGYGTKQHQKALAKWGACEIHREYRPIREMFEL